MDVLLYAGAAAAAALGVIAVARAAWAFNRRVVQIVDLVQELSPDHGQSLKDQVTYMTRDVGEIKANLADLCGRFERHVAEREGSA